MIFNTKQLEHSHDYIEIETSHLHKNHGKATKSLDCPEGASTYIRFGISCFRGFCFSRQTNAPKIPIFNLFVRRYDPFRGLFVSQFEYIIQ